MKSSFYLCLAGCAILAQITSSSAADWARFRGPNGSGVATATKLPTTWSESENLKWKAELPGPGTSSPIIVGDRVFVTCYSGYGVDGRDPGNLDNLKRHLLCFHRNSGDELWSRSIDAVQPENAFSGAGIPTHGYASHTPVSDGERVYVFFGKTGVLAFDLDGKQLWQVSVGTESSGQRTFGSAASPVLYKNLVIVNAAEESQSLVALDKDSGKVMWKAEAAGLSGSFSTPVLVDVGEGQQELVLAVPEEVWAFNPETGRLKWYAETAGDSPTCASLVTQDGIVYRVGGRDNQFTALRAGGGQEVEQSRIVWTSRQQGRINTPVLYEGHLYSISGGIANCIDVKTGDAVFQERLRGAMAAEESRAETEGQRGRGGPEGRGGRGRGGRGGGGGRDYSSPVVADGKLFFINGQGEAFVLAAKPNFEQLAHNRFQSDTSGYSATPAISDGQLFIRSNSALYCVAE